MSDSPYRRLPAVHELLGRPELAPFLSDRGRAAVVEAIREALSAARAAIAANYGPDPAPDSILRTVIGRLEAHRPALRPVINATGILLHTGLGRAPLATEAIDAVAAVSRGACNLEFDLATGRRGQRADGVADLLRRLTGAEAATVVNNNAAATILALRALANGREVIVARGQLVEIGGSFRLPEILEASGARLREVGTTNKVRLSDYERAIGPQTAALLRVHASNFRVVGFTETVEIAALARLARARAIWSVDDIGSGALRPGLPPGLRDEPTIAQSLAAGADLVLCSGDKLLGGPQCGLLVGRRAAIRGITREPLMRAVRVDKMTLAALETTLHLALDPERSLRAIPLWRSLATPLEDLRARGEALAAHLAADAPWHAEVVPSVAHFGGGSAPHEEVPSVALRLDPPYPGPHGSETRLAEALRTGDPPVVARLSEGSVWLDLRSVPPEADSALLAALQRAAR